MNTVMFDLQAAVMAASVSSGSSSLTEIPEDGSSFSDVLAAQKELVTEGAVNQAANADTANNGVVDTEMPEDEANQEFSEILGAIENLDEGVKKALMKLLETVLKAFRGSDDDKERATDLFALFSDGGSGIAEDEEDVLLSCELLSQTGLMIEAELTDGKDADEIIAGLEDVIVEILGKDADETTAAEIMASMLNIPVEQFDAYNEDEKFEAIKGAVELLTAPKQVVSEVNPEDVPKMEQLYADIKEFSVKMNNEIPEMLRTSFTAVKINNASEQVAAISGEVTDEAASAEKASAEKASVEAIPDAAISDEAIIEKIAADIQQPVITADNTVSEAPVITETTAESIQVQVTEVITEKLMSFEGDNGTEELTMILKPENLGEVAVKIIKENGAVTVLLSAQYEEVGKAMADRAALLGNSLQNQNYNVKEVQIVAAGNAAEQMGLDFTNQGFGFMQNRSNNQQNNSNYRGIDAVDGIEETEAVTGTTKLKEAKLWTTA
ncbi:MAG: flagellar hook-length control protein FliK [Oscillospiraceae bacterium]|nr:flagellar hook-length control protein FliK [Oscillospiraceae bacterium]